MNSPLGSGTAPARDSAARRDRLLGLSIIAVAFAVALAISIWAKLESRPETSPPPAPPTTSGVIGFPKQTDPIATLAAARTLTKRPLLRGFVASGVTSEGHVDVSSGDGDVRYTFQSAPGEGPQPTADPTPPRTRRRFCGMQRVRLRKQGLAAETDNASQACPREQSDALPEPRCSLKDVWRHASRRGAPKDRIARIEYYRSAVGPAWRFEIPGTPHRFSLYGDCGRELSGADAVGYVP
jgi:hypothetical protein